MEIYSEEQSTPIYKRLKVNTITLSVLRSAVALGLSDFARSPIRSATFGLIYVLGGLFILATLTYFGQPWMIVPVAIGFPLIAPFVCAGLYEISKLHQSSQPVSLFEILKSSIRKKELGWMAFVVLFVFWIWIYQVRILLAIFLGYSSLSSIGQFVEVVTSTYDGLLFLSVGTIIGAILSTILFSLTVISMPLLLDKEIDVVTAMIFSVKSVLVNPFTMLCWGIFVAILTFFALLLMFLGLIFVLPILGHATWHLYTRTIEELPANH